jgi:hypothetical protein
MYVMICATSIGIGCFAVQLCRSYLGPTGHDRETAGTRDGVQDYGSRARIDARQEKG